VEVHQAEKLDPELVTSLLDYVANPCPSTLLVLLFHKADKKNKLLAALKERGDHIVLSIDTEADRRNFLMAEVKSRGLTISSDAADILLLVTSGELLLLKNTIEKLALINQEITVDLVEQHSMASCEQDVFALARAVSEGRIADSLFGLGHLRNSQENAIKFLGVLLWQMRVLMHIRSCMDQGMSDWDIRKEVSVFGDRFSWMAHVAKKRSLEFHVERLTKLVECDRALKTGATLTPFHVLERYIYQSAVGLF
jgi:DNA polymerase III delta subunit